MRFGGDESVMVGVCLDEVDFFTVVVAPITCKFTTCVLTTCMVSLFRRRIWGVVSLFRRSDA